MKTKSLRKILFGVSVSLLSGTMLFSAILPTWKIADAETAVGGTSSEPVRNLTGTVDTNLEEYYDPNVRYRLPEKVSDDQEISVIVKMDTGTVLDAYKKDEMKYGSVGDFAASLAGRTESARIEREGKALRAAVDKAGISYTLGNTYDTIFSGFELTLKAADFAKLGKAIGDEATLIVGEEYSVSETKVVENDVNIDEETGIFDGSGSGYDGSGTVVAVLDTGLDYTHTAFDPKNYTGTPVITPEYLAGKVSRLTAAEKKPGLTAADVYYNVKVPFTFDYADNDADVYPINELHGTHVAGVIAGNDDRITGVAPNAQLAIMKVFSEKSSGAKTSWLLAALEDCVILGVDVINMSLGSSSGFSREEDEQEKQSIYDSIKAQGISLVCAASNDYNSTYGSERNGNLGLTSNPDSATVGAPSTYDAALSVASISGVKTPYLKYNDSIIYFTEASDRAAEPKDFVDEILAKGETSKTFDYIKIPGVGREVDYTGYEQDIIGKIALVKRGQTNFEEKARIARDKGAAGCIIYNNVSGEISMNVGSVGNYPVCSISQDDGEMLVTEGGGRGTIVISREQVAGPFMSNFSSWGPTPNLGIKPEITAHGGDILSAVPGQDYDRLSGTSMACPNQAGVTALVRQYIKQKFPKYNAVEVTATVNQIMMSTTDIALNTNGLPFSVRKQGSGLANITKVTTTPAYLRSYDRKSGQIMDKAKIELGDDPTKEGVYTLKFDIVNMENTRLVYDVDAIVMTEGVSETLTTNGGNTTVTEKGYLLDGADVEVVSAIGGSRTNDGKVTVYGKGVVTVTVRITLSGKDKSYLDTSFANGMYVEGFVTLKAENGTEVDLNIPYLAFYGDWSRAPMFDLDYFATNKDELDDSIDIEEKTLPDAYATQPLGGLYDEYISNLGSYGYLQDPASTNKISAQREHIALTNQEGEGGGVNSIYGIYCGLLRGAKRMVLTISDSTTGEIIYRQTEFNQQKSYNHGGSVGPSFYEVDFHVADYNLKNNTEYMVELRGYLDYDNDGSETNLNNTFSFPFVTDFEAPIVTGVEYTYEYDTEAKKNRLFANVSVFDNHYVSAIMPGYISYNTDPTSHYTYNLNGFSRYLTPVIGGRNMTNVVQIELTDYIDEIKNSYNDHSFIVQVMDYASNAAIYELAIPDSIQTIEFTENEKGGITISPNQTYTLAPEVFPAQNRAWVETINYTSDNEDIVRVVNGKLVGVSSGTATVTAVSNANDRVRAQVEVTVLKEGDEGYVPYDRPVAESFALTGYEVNKVFYFVSSSERDLGATEAGDIVLFTPNRGYTLKMLPSESVTLLYELNGYLDSSEYQVVFQSSNPDIVEVTKDGVITAMNVKRNDDGSVTPLNSERNASVSVRVQMKDKNGEFKNTIYTQTVNITVKEAYTTNGPYLLSYKGLGGKVVIPEEFGITEISQFAFSNYMYVPKDLSAGDVIDEEDPYSSKIWYIGESTIQEVVIPEGVETIGMYAFANLTGLRKVTLPSTLKKIQLGAFLGCTSLDTVEFSGTNHLQFINIQAFEGCSMLSNFSFDSIVALGDYAFANCNLMRVSLPASAQSIGAFAFSGNARLDRVTIEASKVKFGEAVFVGCTRLHEMTVNASVLPASLFEGCTALSSVKIGPEVSVIGQHAFRNTAVTTFEVDPSNPYFTTEENGTYLLEKDTGKLAVVAPNQTSFRPQNASAIKIVGMGAFSNCTSLTTVNLPEVTEVEDYAFAYCTALRSLQLGELTKVGNNAFYLAQNLSTMPKFGAEVTIGDRAFAFTSGTSVTLPDHATVGEYAFTRNISLTSVTLGNGVTVGEGAFYACPMVATVKIGDDAILGDAAFAADYAVNLLASGSLLPSGESYQGVPIQVNPQISALTNLTIGKNAQIGNYAFNGAGSFLYTSGSTRLGGKLTKVDLGPGASIGDYAFYNCQFLENIDLSEVVSIGEGAFSGSMPAYVNVRYSDGSTGVKQVGVYYTAPSLVSVDLSNAKHLGAGAFQYALVLEDVTLGCTNIEPYTFAMCVSLSSIDLSGVESIGEGAFYQCEALTEVTLGEKTAVIGGGAFNGCVSLTSIDLSSVQAIETLAFGSVALTEVNLESLISLGDFAFSDSSVSSVTFGENLTVIGDNPFVACPISSFARTVGGVEEDTYDLGGGAVNVIGGVLYRTSQYGMELVSYPTLKKGDNYTVETGVVRIGDYAFAASAVSLVELPYTLGAIGDKAFFACENLSIVVFKSIDAPILEEAYDSSLVNSEDERGVPLYYYYLNGYYNVPFNTGEEKAGLEIVPYQMWTADPTNVLFGANFIGMIGSDALNHSNLVMIRPSNGSGYDNYIYSLYFDKILDGPNAATEQTRRVIELIDALPADITLNLEGSIAEIRTLYNSLTAAQAGLVENYETLVNAERTIEYLKSLMDPSGAAAALVARIDALPAEITLEQADEIHAIREAYDALSEDQKSLVTNYSTFEAAENALKALEGDSKPEEPSKGCGTVAIGSGWGGGIAGGMLLLAAGALILIRRRKSNGRA